MDENLKAELAKQLTKEERDEFERQYAELEALRSDANFKAAPVMPVDAHWLHRKTWSIHEAALLANGFNPKTYHRHGRKDESKNEDVRQEVCLRLDGASVVGAQGFEPVRVIERRWNTDPDRPRIEGMSDRVRPNEFIGWCKSEGIDTGWFDEWEKTSLDKPMKASAHEGQPVSIHKIKNRRDILDPHIDNARSQSSNPNDVNVVWVCLVRIAESGIPPFTGKVSATGIHYKDVNGNPDSFTKPALYRRIKRNPISQ